MFHIPTLCESCSNRGMTQVSDARFSVHFFAGNISVNSLLHRSVSGGERKRLSAAPSSRRNVPLTAAHRACAITAAHLNKVGENVFPFLTAAAGACSRELRGTSQDGRPTRKSGVVLHAVSINSLADEPRKIKKRK
jgi:hypothetical protein